MKRSELEHGGLIPATLLALSLTFSACADAPPATSAVPYQPEATHPAVLSTPADAPRVVTDRVDAMGRPVTVGCATCHSLGIGDPARRAGQPLKHFHQALELSHGELTCRSCHASPEYSGLRLADGAAVPWSDVQSLCSQCHGPQARDFAVGLHGGMRGYWDRSRGPQQRHHCTVCHDPHAPAFVGMHPAPPPVDPRFGRGVQ